MAQFVLDSSELDVDVLGPITFATATANLGSSTASATAEITNVVSATASLGGLAATNYRHPGSGPHPRGHRRLPI